MPGKRSDVISWDEFFMRVAIAASLRSKDPNTQVGACIADIHQRILLLWFMNVLWLMERRTGPPCFQIFLGGFSF